MREATANITHDELAKSAMERSRLYGLLATVFRREPSVEFLCHLRTPELIVALTGAGIDFGKEFGTRKFVDIADELAIEYTRLFLGPGKHISPHESVQLKRGSGILWGPETSAVQQSYRAAGFEIGEDETDIPDHLSVELDFLSLLTREESQSWTNQDHEQVSKILRLQHAFISRHLGKWAARFCTKLKEKAEYTYYPAFADLLRSYLSGEKMEIGIRVNFISANDRNSESVHRRAFPSSNSG
jgi:TorA maturation chaperone TorD